MALLYIAKFVKGDRICEGQAYNCRKGRIQKDSCGYSALAEARGRQQERTVSFASQSTPAAMSAAMHSW